MTAIAGTKRAAIYVRVSTATQEQHGSSLETQEAACRAYAADQGFFVDEAQIYRETYTGTELWDRPRLTDLRAALRAKSVDLVIAYAIDRLSRDPVHLGVVLSEAEHAGVDVRFVSEPLDYSPEGQLIRFVRGYAAKIEHAKITERSMRGRRKRAEDGKPLPGPRPLYGYQWVDDKKTRLEPNPSTAPVVIRMFTEAADGAALRQSALGLMASGIPTATGNARWDHSTILDALRRPDYRGDATAYRYTGTKGQTGRGHTHPAPRDAWLSLPANTTPALIDAELFEMVQARLDNNRQRSRRGNTNPEGALLRGGFAKCGLCGKTMTVANRVQSYICAEALRVGKTCRYHAIKIDTLDAAVWARAEALLTQPEIIERELARLAASDSTVADLSAIDRRRAEVRRKQSNVARVIADSDDPDLTEPLLAELASLSAQKRQLDAEHDQVAARRRGWEAARQRLSDLEAHCRSIAARIGTLDYGMRRMALEMLGVEVRVRPRRADGPRYEIIAEIPIPVVAELPIQLGTSWGSQ